MLHAALPGLFRMFYQGRREDDQWTGNADLAHLWGERSAITKRLGLQVRVLHWPLIKGTL
jgi:hypothetical protein